MQDHTNQDLFQSKYPTEVYIKIKERLVASCYPYVSVKVLNYKEAKNVISYCRMPNYSIYRLKKKDELIIIKDMVKLGMIRRAGRRKIEIL